MQPGRQRLEQPGYRLVNVLVGDHVIILQNKGYVALGVSSRERSKCIQHTSQNMVNWRCLWRLEQKQGRRANFRYYCLKGGKYIAPKQRWIIISCVERYPGERHIVTICCTPRTEQGC